jgi:hypothetical protein
VYNREFLKDEEPYVRAQILTRLKHELKRDAPPSSANHEESKAQNTKNTKAQATKMENENRST